MFRSRFVIVTAIGVLFFGLLVAAYRFGQWHKHGDVHYTQAMLAFANYKTYALITDYLEKKCYEAALTEARETRNLQVRLLADNFREAGNKPKLLAYIKVRDPQLLNSVQSGQVPEVRPFTTTCRSR